MFLASTPPKIASKSQVNDYFDSESESSCKKNGETSIIGEGQQNQSKQGNNSLGYIEKDIQQNSQMEVEKLRGMHVISQLSLPESMKQQDMIQFKGYFSSNKKELSPSDKDYSDEDDIQYFKQNSHIFASSVLAEKKSEINNNIDHTARQSNDQNIDTCSISGQSEWKNIQNNNNQLSVNINNQYQFNNSFLSLPSQDKDIQRSISPLTNIINNHSNNIFTQSNQFIINPKQKSIVDSENNPSSSNINSQSSYQQQQQQKDQKGAVVLETAKSNQMIKTQILPSTMDSDKILFDAQYPYKDINQNNFENDILQQDFEIEINQSDDEMDDNEDLSKKEIKVQIENLKQKIDLLESSEISSNSNILQIKSVEKDILVDQNSNQSRIGGLSLKDTQMSSQLKTFFNEYQESSTESEGSREYISKQVDKIFNKNHNNQNSNYSNFEIKGRANGVEMPDPYRNGDYFQKKPTNIQQQSGFARPTLPSTNNTIEQKNKVGESELNKRNELFKSVKETIGFNISNKTKENANFQKFSNLFEGFDDEEEEQFDDNNLDFNMNNTENQFLQVNRGQEDSNSFFKPAKKESSNGFSQPNFAFSKPVIAPKIKNENKAQDAVLKPPQNKEQNKSTSILQDLKQMNGFNVSAHVQKDAKFSKFLGFFEDMNDENEEEDDYFEENKDQKKQELEGNLKLGVSTSEYSSKQPEFGFGFSKPKQSGDSMNDDLGFGFVKPKKNGDSLSEDMGFSFAKPKLNGGDSMNDDFGFGFAKPKKNGDSQSEDMGFGFAKPKLNGSEKQSDSIGFSFSKGTTNGFQKLGKDNGNNKMEPSEPKSKALSKFESMFEEMSDTEEDQLDQSNQEQKYDDFFKKQPASNDSFFGFQTAKNNRKLEVDEKVMQQLMKVFDADDNQQQAEKPTKQKIQKIDEEQEGDDSNKYNDFFSKKSDVPFVGFKIAKGNKELKVDPKKLELLEKAFSVGDEEEPKEFKPVVQANRGIKRKMDIDVDSDQETGFSGFSNAVGNKKLKVDEAKLKRFQAMMDNDDDDDFDLPLKNENSNSKMSLFNKPKSSPSISNGFNSISRDAKRTPTVQAPSKKGFDSNSRFQNSESSFKSSVQSKTKDMDDDDDDGFSRILKLVKKPEPKREHPKPFKQVKVTDSSKTTPVTKTTPTIKSTKISSKFNYKQKLQMSDESGSFLFTKDSADKSGQKSGKSSLSKPFSKPQSVDKIFESGNNEIDKKLRDVFNKNMKRYSFINEEEEEGNGHKRQLFSSSKKSSKSNDLGSAYKQIPVIMSQYLGNPLIQMKYSFDSQLTNVKIVKYEELKARTNKMDIESDSKQSHSEVYAKDINACLNFKTTCNCLNKMMGQFLMDFDENTYSKKIECFCTLPIPSTDPLDEEEKEAKKNIVDQVLENAKSKVQKGYLNYLNFFAKLQQKEKILQERWVRTHFRQVVWKLACYENNTEDCPINKRLTIENIYYELEYRLYSETYACKRSILKQIEEQDAVKSLNMVLVVNNITFNQSHGTYVLELSDGWYSFFVVVFNQKLLNNDMYYQSNKVLILDLIQKKKIYIGMKLYVNHIGQPPVQNLEKFISPNQNLLYQKTFEIFYNNIKQAPATAKLGICDNSLQKYFPRSLKSIRPFGGPEIQTIDVFIIKKYPLCYESGHVKKAFCNPKQMEDEGMDGSIQLGFTILAVDALSYYDQKFQIDQQPWVEVNIHSVTHDLYDSIKEGTRIRLYNVKINNKGQQKSKFDYKQQRIIRNILYFDTTKKTKIEEMGTFIKSKDEQQKMRNFGLEMIENYKFLLEDVQESINNQQYDKEILQSQLELNNVEMDVIMYIVRIENGSFFGINQNYSAICISPTKEIQASSNGGFKKQMQDDEYSKEDAHLYEKLSKNREVKTASSVISEKSNQLPSSLFSNAEEGKIGVFLNVQLSTIKTTTLSTSNLEKYHFNFTFNTHKKTYALDGLNPQALPYSDKYKQWMSELCEFLDMNTEKFGEVSSYLRNC